MAHLRLVLLACLLTAASGAGAVAVAADEPTAEDGPHPAFASVAANPLAENDRGEYVAVTVGEGTNLSSYTLDDGEERLGLPAVNATGTVILTAHPEAVRRPGNRSVVEVPLPRLSNSGERLRLQRDGETVAALAYEDAPEAEVYSDGRWRPVGVTEYPVVDGTSGEARGFVLPDAPAAALAPIEQADERVLLAGYTLTSRRVTDALVRAHDRGARVRVLLEGGPVGGITSEQAARLDRLVNAGVGVRVVDGPATRYRYHHAKYAVADGRATVLTENWKPSGVGGTSSRGWGATVADEAVVSRLAETFAGDFEYRAATPWGEFREGETFTSESPVSGSFRSRTEPATLDYESVSLLTAPDNAEREVVRRIERAESSVRVLQMSVGSVDQSLVAATVEAARRGVEVRILLSGAWYVEKENRRIVDRLNHIAEREGLSLTARLARPQGYEKIHAKGVVIDETVVLGSMNWNDNSARENREVLLAVSGAAVSDYYRNVFDRDWRASGSGGERPAGLIAVLGVLGVGCLLAARRLQFE
ncbi:phospholipase D-like domain-containing protein [Halosegnis longus]|uniref:phospholipase D-like domain-containing protein n=1 Tax=Halosegnis longus TaxID=2216012 RepID=UPI00096A60F4|nr:phospholipase D-like domain-containing protein [Salella cibi]